MTMTIQGFDFAMYLSETSLASGFYLEGRKVSLIRMDGIIDSLDLTYYPSDEMDRPLYGRHLIQDIFLQIKNGEKFSIFE